MAMISTEKTNEARKKFKGNSKSNNNDINVNDSKIKISRVKLPEAKNSARPKSNKSKNLNAKNWTDARTCRLFRCCHSDVGLAAGE